MSLPNASEDIDNNADIDDDNVQEDEVNPQTRRATLNGATIISVSSFFVSSCATVQAAVFPDELRRRGISAYWAAPPFIAYWIMLAFVTSALYRKPLKYKIFIPVGSIITTLAAGFFGVLQILNEEICFIAVSILLRAIEGAGCAIYHEAAENYIRSHFDKNRRFYLGANQSLYYFGFIFGPILGGMIYEGGTFYAPFFTCALCLLLCSIALLFVVLQERDHREFTISLLTFTAPFTLSRALLVLPPYIGHGFNICTMWFHLEHLNMAPTIIGFLIGFPDLIKALCTPLVKTMVSRSSLPRTVFYALGSVLTSLGMFFLGSGFPLSDHLPATLSQTLSSLLVFGLGSSLLLLTPHNSNIEVFQESLSAASLVSVWSFVGAIIGACLSLLENRLLEKPHIGFTIVAAVSYIMAFIGTLSHAVDNRVV